MRERFDGGGNKRFAGSGVACFWNKEYLPLPERTQIYKDRMIQRGSCDVDHVEVDNFTFERDLDLVRLLKDSQVRWQLR